MLRRIVLLVGIVLLAAGCARQGGRAATSGTRVAIAVTDSGFVPGTATVRAGESVTIVVTRQTDQTCAKEIVFPGQNIRKELPLGQPVQITFTPSQKGDVPYTCGMGMVTGKIVIQ